MKWNWKIEAEKNWKINQFNEWNNSKKMYLTDNTTTHCFDGFLVSCFSQLSLFILILHFSHFVMRKNKRSFDFSFLEDFKNSHFHLNFIRLWAVETNKNKIVEKSYPQYRFDNHIEQPIKCSYIFEWRNILYETNKEFIMFVNETFKSTILWMLAEMFMH